MRVETPYEFRHCDFGGGTTTSCVGWLTPEYGAANIIPGMVFASTYDKSAEARFGTRSSSFVFQAHFIVAHPESSLH